MHRRILNCATYRQTSKVSGHGSAGVRGRASSASPAPPHSSTPAPAAGQDTDPDNTLLWRQNLRRLEAEAIRDAVLATSGALNQQMFGRGIFPTLSPEVLSSQSRPGSGWENNQPPAQQARRSTYIFVKRTLGVPLLESFDAASPDTPNARRNVTTVAPQALILLNGEFLERQSVAMADRIAAEAPSDPAAQVELAYHLALCRTPSAAEREVAVKYLARESARWQQLQLEHPERFAPSADTGGTKLAGWEQFGGKWQLESDGSLAVDAAHGAKVIHEKLEVGDGTIEAQVMLREGSGDAGLIVRVNNAAGGVDRLHAYNVNLKKDQVRLGKHQNDWRPLATSAMDLAENQWHDVKVVLEGARIRVYVNQASEPQIDFTDERPLSAGKLGFRSYAVHSAVRNVKVQSSDQTSSLEFKPAADSFAPPAPPAQRALASLCKLMMNLNEFIYVD